MMSATLDTSGMDRFAERLTGEMRAAIPLALTYLKQLAIQIVARMGAIDTLALLISIYISSWGYSEYQEAKDEAMDAYQLNPTKYPGIRAVRGGFLETVDELKPNSPDEGWLGVAAAHGAAVEEGYISFYGNDIPARPFIHDTAAEGFSIVLREMQKALQRALK